MSTKNFSLKYLQKPIEKRSCKNSDLLESRLERVRIESKVNKSQTRNKKKKLNEVIYQKLKIKNLN